MSNNNEKSGLRRRLQLQMSEDGVKSLDYMEKTWGLNNHKALDAAIAMLVYLMRQRENGFDEIVIRQSNGIEKVVEFQGLPAFPVNLN